MSASPYSPVFHSLTLRRVLAGIGVSSVGDGLSTVGISWLMLQLAPPGEKGLWVAFAVASYNLPGALGTFLLAPWMRNRTGAQLAAMDATTRACALILVPLTYFAGVLSAPLLVGLLATSSILNSWGKSGRYVLVAELLPVEHRLAGNAVVNVVLELSYVAGPPLAALLLLFVHPSLVIGVDAMTFAVMASMYRFGLPGEVYGKRIAGTASRSMGFRTIFQSRTSTVLVTVSFVFFFLFGFVGVALPVYVGDELKASAGVLAGYLTAFGLGAFLGAFGAGYLRRWPVLRSALLSVLGVGLFVIPAGMPIPAATGWISFGVAGLFWGPFPATTTAYFQSVAQGPQLAAVLAARSAMQLFALPAGTLLAGPLVLGLGPRSTLLLAGILIVALTGAAAALVVGPTRTTLVDDLAAGRPVKESA